MIIVTKYNIGDRLYSITRFSQKHFTPSEHKIYINSIVYSDTGLSYKLLFDNDYSSYFVNKNCINDLENGYYFSSLELAQKACNIANNN